MAEGEAQEALVRTSHIMDPSVNGEHSFKNSTQDSEAGKIFVGGISWETTKENLEKHFAKFGDIEQCSLKFDPVTKRPRGFAFITFKDASVVDKVLNAGQHILDGKTLDPKRAQPMGKPPPPFKTKKIFVGGLKPDTPEEKIKEFFGKFAPVVGIEFSLDRSTNKRRAFCFIEFGHEDDVERVLERQFHDLNGNRVEVKRALPKELQQQHAAALRAAAALRPVAPLTAAGYPLRAASYPVGYAGSLYPAAYPAPYATYDVALAAYPGPPTYSYGAGAYTATTPTAAAFAAHPAYEFTTAAPYPGIARELRYADLRPSSYGPVTSYTRQAFHPYARDARL